MHLLRSTEHLHDVCFIRFIVHIVSSMRPTFHRDGSKSCLSCKSWSKWICFTVYPCSSASPTIDRASVLLPDPGKPHKTIIKPCCVSFACIPSIDGEYVLVSLDEGRYVATVVVCYITTDDNTLYISENLYAKSNDYPRDWREFQQPWS